MGEKFGEFEEFYQIAKLYLLNTSQFSYYYQRFRQTLFHQTNFLHFHQTFVLYGINAIVLNDYKVHTYTLKLNFSGIKFYLPEF